MDGIIPSVMIQIGPSPPHGLRPTFFYPRGVPGRNCISTSWKMISLLAMESAHPQVLLLRSNRICSDVQCFDLLFSFLHVRLANKDEKKLFCRHLLWASELFTLTFFSSRDSVACAPSIRAVAAGCPGDAHARPRHHSGS